MNGKDILKGLSYIDPAYVEAAQSCAAEKRGVASGHRFLLIAAIAATLLLLLTGAAAYSKWASGLEARYHPSESVRKQSEENGLSVTYPQETAREENSGLSAEDQGITVSVKQTLVDALQAKIVLSVQGFALPDGVRPYVYVEPGTLDGDAEFWSSFSYDVYDGILPRDDGTYVYEDGTPVVEDHYTEDDVKENGFFKGRYYRPDGSMELTLNYRFQNTDGSVLGKNLNLHFTGFGKETAVSRGNLEQERLVSGSWELTIPLNGTTNTVTAAPNYRFGPEGPTLLTASIGPMSGRLDYQLDSPLEGFDQLEFLQPAIAGIRMKDGSLVSAQSRTEGYSDREKLLFYVEFEVSEGIVDLSQAAGLVFYDPQTYEPTIEVPLT